MSLLQLPEVWLRGPIENIPSLLQPVAHALLEASKEISDIIKDFPEQQLWEKPAGVASVGFHLQHLTGVLDRLFTYARGESLSQEQLNYLNNEGKPADNISTIKLLEQFNNQVDFSLKQLTGTNTETLTEYRSVGRKQLPSTVIGLSFHSAEHTMRHVGQLLVTIQILKFKLQ